MKVEIKSRFTGAILIQGDYKSVKDCLEQNRHADLRGADLRDADLGGADLRGADLRDIKGYSESHDMFAEAIRRQKADMFTNAEWEAIGQIVIYRLCWDSIKKRFNEVMPSIFSKLADVGFDEWLKRWNEINC